MGIIKVKHCYKLKVEEHYSKSNPVLGHSGNKWLQGQQLHPDNHGCLFPEQAKSILCSLWKRHQGDRDHDQTPADHQSSSLTSTDVQAAGPDGIPGCVLRACVEQLTGVFKDIFNLSLALASVLACFKSTSIVAVLKHSNLTCLNDYHTVAFTPIAMMCFERLVLAHLKNASHPHSTHTSLPTAEIWVSRM